MRHHLFFVDEPYLLFKFRKTVNLQRSVFLSVVWNITDCEVHNVEQFLFRITFVYTH